MTPPSQMRVEAQQAPEAVARLLHLQRQGFVRLGESWRAHPPRSFVTLARGSSDHAAHYAAYLLMARTGRIVASLPMSLFTLQQPRLLCDGLAVLAFSQSGQSPDLVAPMRYMGVHGAQTVALVNDVASPLARVSRQVIGLEAGPEHSVAATKSFICQLAAGVRLVSAWQPDSVGDAALEALPELLERACELDWSHALEALASAQHLYVVGRGTGLPVALEMALKFKEVCRIQAEAFSGAELRHGPLALVHDGFPVLVLAPRGPAQAGLLALAGQLRERGAQVLLAAPVGTAGAELPLLESADVDLEPIAAVQAFYPMVEALARARGLDPDRPHHLSKVTRTI